MRVPKFRAWDEDSQKMNGNVEIYIDKDKTIEVRPKDNKTIVMQSTGLVDENGKEIFEGDVALIYGEKISKVFYSQGSFCVDILNGGTPLHGFSPKQLEVIGNVWENKELLEEEK